MELAKLLTVLALIIFALRKKVSVGPTLFVAGLLTALLYQVSFQQLLDGYWALVKSERFLSLTAVIVLITILGSLLKELGFLQRLANACKQLPGGNRTATAILPFLIGLMPMPGGALLSAPLVENVLSDPRYRPEFKTATNYWFRHLVEFFWPVYPGIILTEAITGMPMFQVALLQLPLSVIMVGLGAIYFSRHIELGPQLPVNSGAALKGIVRSLWPIGGAIAVFAIFKVNMAWAVTAATLALILATRPTSRILIQALRKGFSYKLIFLVFGILSFQTVLELSSAITRITQVAQQYNFPPEMLVILVCFSLGLLTGMVAAYVGMGYILLAGFLYQPSINPGNIMLAYLSGYVGMLLAPTHLCLVLTNNYFKSNLISVYKLIILPLLILAVLGYLISQSFWPTLFLVN
jgi:integral membrane protein (TIGR00529 family)